MRAVTVVPGVEGSVRVDEVPEPATGLGSVEVEAPGGRGLWHRYRDRRRSVRVGATGPKSGSKTRRWHTMNDSRLCFLRSVSITLWAIPRPPATSTKR
jgi:hypothetical protein